MSHSSLLIGDPHVTVDELQDAEALLRLILETVSGRHLDSVIFLGDLHHNHSNVRVEVMQFWLRVFDQIKCKSKNPNVDFYSLVGNHDRPADANSTAHALMAYVDCAGVVDKPLTPIPGVLMLPYYHDPLAFIAACVDFAGTETVICHQEFNGAKFENGFYAPNGVNPDDIPQNQVISGHIHSPQEFGKVWYPGAPRWRISTDANIYRALQVVEFDETGKPISREPVSTDTHCRKLIHLVFEEGRDQFIPELRGPAAISIDMCGGPEWVKERREYWSRAPNVTISCFPTREKNTVVSESQGIVRALTTFVSGFKTKNGTSAEVLAKMVAERVRL